MSIPKGWFYVQHPNPDWMLAQPISLKSPWGFSLASISSAIEHSHHSSDNNARQYADQIIGALALASGQEPSSSCYSTRIFQRLLTIMSENAHIEALSPRSVAGKAGISLRSLHSIFRDHGTTYRTELYRIRFDRSVGMLLDPRFDAVTVAEIGSRCGFPEASHFSKLFRKRLGYTPGACRARRDRYQGSVD